MSEYKPSDDELRAMIVSGDRSGVSDVVRLALETRKEHELLAGRVASYVQRAEVAEADLAKAQTRLEIEQRRPELDVLRARAEQAEALASEWKAFEWKARVERDEARARAEKAEAERDQARAAARVFNDVVTAYMLGDIDGAAISRAQSDLRAAIAGDVHG